MQTYHLYSDGNYFPRAKKSGFGGYIESPNGEIIVEYTEQIKQPEYIHNFELLGIIRGLEIAKSNGIQNIISHCDDKNTTIKLKEIFEDNIYNISPSIKPELFDRIIELSKEFKNIKFQYIPRSLNKHADSLSRRYAKMMEENFLKQYNEELDAGQRRFENNDKPKKKIYFSHKSILRNPYKNNPFLVAPYRNKKVRRISKDEQQNPYNYLFVEIYSVDEQISLKSTQYDPNHKKISTFEKKINNTDNLMTEYCSFFSESINNLKGKFDNLWVDTNYRPINNFFEQKEKINKDLFDDYKAIHDSLNKFKRVFFHAIPFEPDYVMEIKEQERKKAKIDNNIESLDSLMEKLEKGALGKDKNKHFAAIIRHQLKSYQATLTREIDEIEKNQIIEKTVKDLNKKGFNSNKFTY